MKPQELACFENVAKVIGQKKANKELRKVIKSGSQCDLAVDEASICAAFSWNDTPQGHEFWDLISRGVA